jgi:sirohydrochlorin cobaltochelatase
MSTIRSPCPPARATEHAPGRWRRCGLLVVGHGSSDLEVATEDLRAHAATLRARNIFGAVETGFLKGPRTTEAGLERLEQDDVYVVPFFLGEGYFTEVAVPRRLGLTGPVTEARCRGGTRRLRYCRPVGCSPTISAALAKLGQRAAHAERRDTSAIRLLVIGHGNPESGASSRLLRQHVASLETEGRFRSVQVAFIEESPLLADALTEAAEEDTVVVGALAGQGHHALDDIPEAVAAEKSRRGAGGRLIAYAGIIGSKPEMADLIIESVQCFTAGILGRVSPSLVRNSV